MTRPDNDVQEGEPLRFRDLMASVGYFLFYWASLEQELFRTLTAIRSNGVMDERSLPSGMKGRLEIWREFVRESPELTAYAEVAVQVERQALALREIRNHIVHGLEGGVTYVDGEPYISCSINDEIAPRTIKYKYSDLEHFTQGIDACRRALIRPENFNYLVELR